MRSRGKKSWVALASLGVVTTGAMGHVGTVAAAPTTVEFGYVAPDDAGSEVQRFTVPEGVCEVAVVAVGASGSDAAFDDESPAGGLGGSAMATLAVTPGEVLEVRVGGTTGTNVGGFNGGGDATAVTAGDVSYGAGGGGGASDVRQGGTGSADRVLVAGGGGGGGLRVTLTPGVVFGPHGGGGTGGGEVGGSGGTDAGGGGGTVDAGGSAGPGAAPGSPGAGGAGGSADFGGEYFGAGGGGGGGWFGGGGGGASAATPSGGGGGGSGYGPAGTVFGTAASPGPGWVTITYDPADGGCPVEPPDDDDDSDVDDDVDAGDVTPVAARPAFAG